jgi:hypothetical protein
MIEPAPFPTARKCNKIDYLNDFWAELFSILMLLK